VAFSASACLSSPCICNNATLSDVCMPPLHATGNNNIDVTVANSRRGESHLRERVMWQAACMQRARVVATSEMMIYPHSLTPPSSTCQQQRTKEQRSSMREKYQVLCGVDVACSWPGGDAVHWISDNFQTRHLMKLIFGPF